jgi:hypothetical protein
VAAVGAAHVLGELACRNENAALALMAGISHDNADVRWVSARGLGFATASEESVAAAAGTLCAHWAGTEGWSAAEALARLCASSPNVGAVISDTEIISVNSAVQKKGGKGCHRYVAAWTLDALHRLGTASALCAALRTLSDHCPGTGLETVPVVLARLATGAVHGPGCVEGTQLCGRLLYRRHCPWTTTDNQY